MKVIDFHVHDTTTYKPVVLEFIRGNNTEYFDRFGGRPGPDQVISYFASQGVSRVVMLAEYAPDVTGTITNESIAKFCRNHERLVPVGSLSLDVDKPYEEQARYAVEELGMKGFKLLPSYQHYYPNDPAFFPFYRYMQDKGLPVMFHTGSSIFGGTRIKYADPLLLDDVADEFPDLTILMEHGGRPFWYDRAAWMVSRHRNVHIGLAGMPISRLPELFQNLERFSDRYIFGSDWPAVPLEVNGLIKRVLALPYSDTTKENILYRNAERVLNTAGI
jgi:predicted TIM-barrel fold metal-dependent hydrolase